MAESFNILFRYLIGLFCLGLFFSVSSPQNPNHFIDFNSFSTKKEKEENKSEVEEDSEDIKLQGILLKNKKKLKPLIDYLHSKTQKNVTLRLIDFLIENNNPNLLFDSLFFTFLARYLVFHSFIFYEV